jgi:hypothetical protein
MAMDTEKQIWQKCSSFRGGSGRRTGEGGYRDAGNQLLGDYEEPDAWVLWWLHYPDYLVENLLAHPPVLPRRFRGTHAGAAGIGDRRLSPWPKNGRRKSGTRTCSSVEGLSRANTKICRKNRPNCCLPEPPANPKKTRRCTFYVRWSSCFSLRPSLPSNPHQFFPMRS